MNGYEKIVTLIQDLSKTASSFLITTMDTNSSCKANGTPLDSDDLFISEQLKTGWYRKEGNEFVYVEPIKAGDTVLLIKVNEEQYVILERLVSV
jgi:hypothetical protein